jgi:NAD-dependent deacetylase
MNQITLKKLYSSESLAILSGAGISAASGVPTFRGPNGLWKNYRAEELANYHAFIKQPELVWEWYSWRRGLINRVKPNAAHLALVDLESIFNNFTIITQNVDNLHQKAGSKKVIELHGNIMRSKCIHCDYQCVDEKSHTDKLPECPNCQSLVRPDVVWFGETLPLEALHKSQKIASSCQLFLSIGTSGVVEPAASLPFIAKENGAYIVEINRDETPLTAYVDDFINQSAEIVLPEVLSQLKNLKYN